jgi:hypothetical protein
VAQVHVIALPNGDLLLAYDDDANLRTPLALAMSRNGGASWHRVRCGGGSALPVPSPGEF